MRRAKLVMIKDQIIAYFDAQAQRVFTIPQLSEILSEQRVIWELPKSTTLGKFATFLEKEGKLSVLRFKFIYCPTTLACWGDATFDEIALSIRPECYFSHISAMLHHDLINDALVHTIYVNDEQSPKPRSQASLEQSRIDQAFKRAPRTSNNKVTIKLPTDELTIYLLSGMHTGKLGVIESNVPEIGIPVRVTNIERTLIDIVVRPMYAGGVQHILEAYRRAAGHVDVERMAHLLEQLQYVYPYHQAIGFLLSASGACDQTAIEHFRKLPQHFDFYLDYRMQDARYAPEWKLYYPSDLLLNS